jgi:hypothetical protein
LIGVPVTWAAWSLAVSWPIEGSPSPAVRIEAPIVVLSPELEPVYAGERNEAPVVRPSGYLLPELPEDVAEDASHAGS